MGSMKRLAQILQQEPNFWMKNHNLIKKYNLPSFSDLSYGETTADSTTSPHITFITNSSFNPPPPMQILRIYLNLPLLYSFPLVLLMGPE
ncbi:hypothetical protein VP01_7926g1 [Puccinia sorghi]|uniref:Uncharacterized protein n=1 Tax=Puccinia sorghi TaxID=27349 RepID=A0A0L6UAX0_9BASI|nr:hypothetical protein VP01_7926g1 [Puccinia sorghi]